ncbi:hypothetical protein ACV0BM_000355 [Elizabethkingia meningoseptica]
MLRNISDKRETLGEQIFSIITPDFEKVDVDVRARLALLVGGMYYLSLHANSNGSTFCGIDINETEGKERIERAIVSETYEKAKIDK